MQAIYMPFSSSVGERKIMNLSSKIGLEKDLTLRSR